ncbi:MAG TPA: 16S rRNA (cytosine(967)-C(5))-methyltransferase RsmB [Nitrospiria bacterium]|nr:16S rRNA (cytosine(967)-C(5))-methyltransferase RsmB [Nitrospiria bacterium]
MPISRESQSGSPAATRGTPARHAAVTALVALDTGRTTVQQAIDHADREFARGSPLSVDDRALLHELVNGVLRHRLFLDWALQQVAREQPYTRQALLRQILRVGAYQLLLLKRIPAYAAVDQSVELAKARLGPKSAPLVNALLRNLSARRHDWAMPELLRQPVEHISINYSHPPWLVKRWLKRYGVQRTIALCRANNEPAPLTIRVNRLKLDAQEFQRVLQEKGIEATLCAYAPAGLYVEHEGPVTALPGYGSGWFYVQDEASQLVPLLLAPKPGDTALDACAAPGGKATEIAELMEDRGTVTAVDRSPERLAVVEENCRRLGVTIVRTVAADATRRLPMIGPDGEPERYDRILVDAPCSGLGVLRRHPEGKWIKTARSIHDSARTASAILSNVIPLLRPGGVLVYSTCSTEPEENEEVVAAFLERHRNVRLEHPGPLLPAAAATLLTREGYLSTVLKGGRMDGFFAARMIKERGP